MKTMQLQALRNEILATVGDNAHSIAIITGGDRKILHEVKMLFPYAEINAYSLPETEINGRSSYDLIVCADIKSSSALGDTLSKLSEHLEHGVLYLKVSFPSGRTKYRESHTSELMSRYEDYVFRLIGLPDQTGKYTSPTWVMVRRKKPVALLFMGTSRDGKTVTSIYLGTLTGLTAVKGDLHLMLIATGQVPVSRELHDIAQEGYVSMDWSYSIREIFSRGYDNEFFNTIPAFKAGTAIIFDMWVPMDWQERVISIFESAGFFVMTVGRSRHDELLRKEAQLLQIQRSIVMQLANRYQGVAERLLPRGTRRRCYYETVLSGIRVILNEGWHQFWIKSKRWFGKRAKFHKSAHF